MITTALRLPTPDIEALIEGRTIAAMPRMFINPQRQFALYPSDTSINALPNDQYYRSNFLPTAQKALVELGSETVLIKAWARCELCQIINEAKAFDVLSQLTVWTEEGLQQTLSQQGHIFLAYLRVYRLTQPIEIPVNPNPRFVPLPQPLVITAATPVLSDRIFAQRRRQLETPLPPPHPELEELQSEITQLAVDNPAVEKLNYHIQTFLGWASEPPVKQPDPDLAWINTINALGTAITGGNYQKGTAFEQIVHRSLAFLGFRLDPNAKGGAGGMDLYCTTPYPLVGECKAGQTIPSDAVQEIIRLGGTHLGLEKLAVAVKLIIGPGKLAPKAQKSAQEFGISVINPMTLQKLAELQAKYPGFVNLIELKEYLEPGHIDYRIDEYIEKVQKNIKLRSQIVEAVQQLGEPGSEHLTVEIRVHYNAVFAKEPNSKLDELQVHDLLVELSSPLTGYLGRIKGSDLRSDRFYFLRELKVD